MFISMNKDRKIICILSFLLLVIFGGYQTNLTFKNLEITKLQKEIEQLKSDNDAKDNKIYTTGVKSNDSQVKPAADNEIVDTEDSKNGNTIVEDTKKRFIDFGKKLNKEYNQGLQGKEVVNFEAIDWTSITDNQIKKNIERLNGSSFNIRIEKNKLGDGYFYKIILIE